MQQLEVSIYVVAKSISKSRIDIYGLAIDEGIEVAGLALGQDEDVDTATEFLIGAA